MAVDASTGLYPSFDQMPGAERVEQVPMVGPAQSAAANTEAIDAQIEDHNHDQLVGPSPWNCATARRRPEPVLAMLALFGLAWLHRAPRRQRER